MEKTFGTEVAEQMLDEICESMDIDIDIVFDSDDDDGGKPTRKKLVSAISYGRLEFEDEKFKLILVKPFTAGSKEITHLNICEPTGVQLRGMAKIKKKRDDVGKAMAILGEVTGLGLPIINELHSRDLMVAVSVISLFL